MIFCQTDLILVKIKEKEIKVNELDRFRMEGEKRPVTLKYIFYSFTQLFYQILRIFLINLSIIFFSFKNRNFKKKRQNILIFQKTHFMILLKILLELKRN